MDDSGNVHMSAEEERRQAKLKMKRNSNGTMGRNGHLPPIQTISGDVDAKKPVRLPVVAESWAFMNGGADSPLHTPSEGSITGSSIWSDMSKTRFEAESPDELALVRAAATYGCCLKKRSHGKVTVHLPGISF